jgi:hypothetical protein
MTLRHIDPRSTDWMDAMLEGEPARKSARELARAGGANGSATEADADAEMLGAGTALAPPGQAMGSEPGLAPAASGP